MFYYSIYHSTSGILHWIEGGVNFAFVSTVFVVAVVVVVGGGGGGCFFVLFLFLFFS